MNKEDWGGVVMAGILLFMGVLSAFSGMSLGPIPEQVVQASMGVRLAPAIPQNRSGADPKSKEECFPTDAKQPFKFKLCYVPGKSYGETSLYIVLPPGTPQINSEEFYDPKRSAATVVSSYIPETDSDVSVRVLFGLRGLFDLARPVAPSDPEFKLAVTLKSAYGTQSRVEGTLRLAP